MEKDKGLFWEWKAESLSGRELQNIYEKKEEQGAEAAGFLATVLEGEAAGEKLFCLGKEEICRERLERFREGRRVFAEPLGERPKLVICGGGHVSMPVIAMGRMLGFFVTVLEDRPKFADAARRAGADRVICDSFKAALSALKSDGETYYVIVTRGHRYDADCLYTILKSGKARAYVGMMGSRRRTAIVKREMAERGIPEGEIEKIHTPIGLSIGAETPEEIAVSILAELIQVKNQRGSGCGFPKEIREALCENADSRKRILVTIVSRQGSAPRSVGTKMVVFEDGETKGTIGGGCAESAVIARALRMMRMGAENFALDTVDMTAGEAEEEGMVCGGRIQVMLERAREDR